MFVVPLGPSQSTPAPKEQNLYPEVTESKMWSTEVDKTRNPIALIWEGSRLSASLKHGGGFIHAFKAKLLDTSSPDVRSFDLILEDQVHDDHCESIKYTTLIVDLKDHVTPPGSFRVLVLRNDKANLQGEFRF